MTKPAAREVVVRTRSAPVAAESDTEPPSGAVALPFAVPLPLAAPRPLSGLARPTPGGSFGEPPPATSAVARLRRQADRQQATRQQAIGMPDSPLSLPTLAVRALPGRPVIRRQVVTQLSLGGERRDEITGVAVVGRPPNTFGGSMGDHTTAFTVHVNAVQHLLRNAPLAEAAARLGVLISELRSLPGYALVTELLPERQLKLWQAALATITDIRPRIAAGSQDLVSLIQQYVGAYLELRELVPLSTINTGEVSKATSGKGKGEAVDALPKQAAGTAQKPEALAKEVLGLFDARAAALACAETRPDQLARLAPGLPAKLSPRERGHLIVLQHLRSIQTGYPGALAALAGEEPKPVTGASGDSPAKVAADRRAAAQEADNKVLGRLIDEILSNHVMPRMVTALLSELPLLQASAARDAEAAKPPKPTGDRALDAATKTKAAVEARAKYEVRRAQTQTRIDEITTILGSESAFAAKPSTGPSGSGLAKAEPKDDPKSGGDMVDEVPVSDGSDGAEQDEEAGGDLRLPTNVRTKRKRNKAVDPMEAGRQRTERQLHERRLQQLAKPDKRARVGSPPSGMRGAPGKVGSESARPLLGSGQPVAEPEAPAAKAGKARQTVQVVLGEDGNVAEVRAAGRPASPFPATMGAHTTAWTVHLDRVRALLIGKSVAQAIATVNGKLATEREAHAEALGEQFGFKHPVRAVAPVADGPDTLVRLQDVIVFHLEQVNLTAGATLPSADTGGKNEGKHRRVLKDPASPKAAVRTAILGLLDVGGLLDDTASVELTVGDDALQVLVRQHLVAIEGAYPGAPAKAGLGAKSMKSILKELRTRDAAEKAAKSAGSKSVGSKAVAEDVDSEDDDEDGSGSEAAEVSGSGSSKKPALALDDELFGAHKPPADPGAVSGRPESGLAPLLGSAATLVGDGEADRNAAALWVDPAGNLIGEQLARFTAAYTADIADRGTYLAEGEGTVAARHFGVSVQVYRDRGPAGFEIQPNLGGGDCLLYALQHVAQASQGQPLTDLSGGEIATARQAIVAGLPAEAAQNAVRVIVTDAVAQRHTAGLGARMRGLLANLGFRHAAAWVRTAQKRQADEARLKAKDEPPKPKPAPKKESAEPVVHGPVEIRHQAVYGDGVPLVNQALLHTGGNHYVALIRRAPAPVREGGPASGSGVTPARSSSGGSGGLGMVPIPSSLPRSSPSSLAHALLLAQGRPSAQGRPPSTGTPERS